MTASYPLEVTRDVFKPILKVPTADYPESAWFVCHCKPQPRQHSPPSFSPDIVPARRSMTWRAEAGRWPLSDAQRLHARARTCPPRKRNRCPDVRWRACAPLSERDWCPIVPRSRPRLSRPVQRFALDLVAHRLGADRRGFELAFRNFWRSRLPSGEPGTDPVVEGARRI